MQSKRLWIVLNVMRYTVALFCAGYAINEWSQGQASEKWPTVAGEVTTSYIKKVSSKHGTKDVAEVQYQYEVNGKKYMSDRIKFGGTDFQDQQSIVQEFKPDSKVSIHYKVGDPAVSCIKTGVNMTTLALYSSIAALLVLMSFVKDKKQDIRINRTIYVSGSNESTTARSPRRSMIPVYILGSLGLLFLFSKNFLHCVNIGSIPADFFVVLLVIGAGLLFFCLLTSLPRAVAMLMRNGKLDLAEVLAKLNSDIACGMSPHSQEAAMALGLQAEIAQEQLNYAKALEFGQKALNALEGNPRVEINAGGIGEESQKDRALRQLLLKNQQDKAIAKSLCHESLGCTLSDMGMHTEALEHANTAKRFAHDYLKDASSIELPKAKFALACALALKGRCEIAIGAIDDAINDLKEAVRLRKELPNLFVERLASTLADLATAYSLQSETGMAEKAIAEGLKLVEDSQTPSHQLAVAKLRSHLADIRMRAGQFAAAEKLITESRQVREQLLAAGHPEIARTYLSLANLRELQGNERDAVTLRKSANRMLSSLR